MIIKGFTLYIYIKSSVTWVERFIIVRLQFIWVTHSSNQNPNANPNHYCIYTTALAGGLTLYRRASPSLLLQLIQFNFSSSLVNVIVKRVLLTGQNNKK